MMRYQIGRSIHDFDQGAWNALTGDKLMMSYAWLHCMEDIQKRSRPFYALISDAAGPLAALAAPYMNTIEPLQVLSGRRTAAALARLLLLATVPFYGESSGLVIRTGVALDKTLPRLEPTLKEICRRSRRMILAIGNVAEKDIQAWRRLDFQDYELPPGCALCLPPNYSSYQELLNGHDRRELARMRRVAEKGGTRFEIRSDMGDDAELYDLLCERYAHHGVPRDEVELTPDMFKCLQKDFLGGLVLFTARVRDKLAGYVLALHRRDELYLLFSGYRYELSRPNFVYFLLYDEAIRWGLDNEIRMIDAGTTMLTEKAKQGFRPVRRWICWRATARPVNAAFKIIERPLNIFLSRAWSMLRRPRSPALVLLTLAALLGPGTAGSSQETDRLMVDSFSDRTEADGRPSGWESLTFKNQPRHTSYTVEREGNNYYVKAVSSAAVSAIVKKVHPDLKKYPFLSWRWKIEGVIKKADALHKSGDDCAARVYVAFAYDPKRATPWKRLQYNAVKLVYGHYPPQAVLNYIWDNRLPKETSLDNAHTSRSKMIVVESGNEKAGQWINEKRDVYADYKKLFGGQPPEIDFVALMTDTDNTGESAVAYYDDIAFEK